MCVCSAEDAHECVNVCIAVQCTLHTAAGRDSAEGETLKASINRPTVFGASINPKIASLPNNLPLIKIVSFFNVIMVKALCKMEENVYSCLRQLFVVQLAATQFGSLGRTSGLLFADRQRR